MFLSTADSLMTRDPRLQKTKVFRDGKEYTHHSEPRYPEQKWDEHIQKAEAVHQTSQTEVARAPNDDFSQANTNKTHPRKAQTREMRREFVRAFQVMTTWKQGGNIETTMESIFSGQRIAREIMTGGRSETRGGFRDLATTNGSETAISEITGSSEKNL